MYGILHVDALHTSFNLISKKAGEEYITTELFIEDKSL